MNVALALTAAYHGATVANHCEVMELTKNEQGHVNGAMLKDTLTGDEWSVKAKVMYTHGNESKIEILPLRVHIGCDQRYWSFH
jgi:succinate dehydrogenase/fumarate reductase flavoprotein subunit